MSGFELLREMFDCIMRFHFVSSPFFIDLRLTERIFFIIFVTISYFYDDIFVCFENISQIVLLKSSFRSMYSFLFVFSSVFFFAFYCHLSSNLYITHMLCWMNGWNDPNFQTYMFEKYTLIYRSFVQIDRKC